MKPLALLDLPEQIRYIVFGLLLRHNSIILDMKRKDRVKDDLNSVHGCIGMLNLSHQLLNPAYSSLQLAQEAAYVFYAQNVFQVNILDLPSFMWILTHMPSIGSFDPLSAITRLRLCLNCDRTRADTIRDENYRDSSNRDGRRRSNENTSRDTLATDAPITLPSSSRRSTYSHRKQSSS